MPTLGVKDEPQSGKAIDYGEVGLHLASTEPQLWKTIDYGEVGLYPVKHLLFTQAGYVFVFILVCISEICE